MVAATLGWTNVAAAGTGSVTLTASSTHISPGQAVDLTVTIDPPTRDEVVSIVDAGGSTVANGVTDGAGRFTATFTPDATITLRAYWGAIHSDPVTVDVSSGGTATLRITAGTVRLFADLKVRGRVTPHAGGGTVKVQLLRFGRVVATQNAVVGARGRFRAALRISRPGTYRAKAILDRPGVTAASDASAPQATELPDLAEGATGIFVSLLEQRLVQLHYHLIGVDDGFDFRTADAVMAFRKVQRMPRTETVTAAVWRALADPSVFRPHNGADGFHIEVDQTRQVLATVMDGKVRALFHVSTGKASTPTRDGTFHVFSKLAGLSPKGLYYPSFFDGGRAIHGWTDVPNYPASHGCVRVPYWIAVWIYGLADYGTPVIVYH
jgi:N-acetylmuramoyl-L-alanine amidase